MVDLLIWLLRHGDAQDGSPDAERPLTEKGEAQARAAGAALAALGVEFDACLASPRVRALDSARLACGPLTVEVRVEERLSGGEFDALELTAGLGDHVMLVGHEPDFSQAVQDLTGARVRMRKGGLAGVEDGELRVLLRPKDLSLIAKGAAA